MANDLMLLGIGGSDYSDPLYGISTPSLDLQFAANKSLTDVRSGNNLVTFTRASSGTFVDSAGVLQTASTNEPRFDHNPITGESLGLLVEEQRTNLLLNSATLSTQNVTVTAVAHTLSFTGTGTITLSGTSTAGPLVGTGTGEANRVSLTFTPTAGTLTLTVSGTVTNAQLEIGAFRTSYIPTTTATATRSADVASVNTLSPWFNATEGTLFAEAVFGALDNFKQIANFNNATSSELLAFQTGTAPASRVSVVDGGIGQATLAPGNLTVNTGFKISLAYKENDFAAVLNGGTVQTDAAGTLPTVTQMNLGGLSAASGVSLIWLRRITYFRQRLSNANLQRITQ